MRRHAPLLGLLLLLLASAPAEAAKPTPSRSWAQAEIKLVVERGLMAADAAGFRPDDLLTQAELAELAAGITLEPQHRIANPAAPVTMAALDARLVRILGLQDAAATFAAGARSAGLAPPSRFGTEVVARLLGLRRNHPAAHDELERLPTEPATRAEAAYSAARILRFGEWELDYARAAAAAFVLPALSPWQRRILTTAFRFIGFPYVWGGESESTQSPFGGQIRGGFDCSGFVWRVYKLEQYPGAGVLPATLRGRTTFAMSGEAPKPLRIPLARLVPGDVVFFGAKGARSKPAEVDHMGIYAGNGWVVHSSSQGVALAPLAGWYLNRFAWARRPLAEAGLVPADALSKQ